MAYEWHNISKLPKVNNEDLPYNYACAMIYYNNKFHLLGGRIIDGTARYHYTSSDGKMWTREEDLPYDFEQGCAVIYDGLHILGGATATSASKHYVFNNDSWSYKSTLPYAFTNGAAYVVSSQLHIFGSSFSGNEKKHYSYNGSAWTSRSTLPVNWTDGTQPVHVIVYNDQGDGEVRLALIGGSDHSSSFYLSSNITTTAMTWTAQAGLQRPFIGKAIYSSGTDITYYAASGGVRLFGQAYNYSGAIQFSWTITIITNLPSMSNASPCSPTSIIWFKNDKKLYTVSRNVFSALFASDYFEFSYGSAVVYDNKIHIICNNKMYYYDQGAWVDSGVALPYYFYTGAAVVYGNKIHILGGGAGYDADSPLKHYSWDGTSWSVESTLPYSFSGGRAVVYDGKIHLLSSSSTNDKTKHYSWDGTEWTEESTLPYGTIGAAVVYSGEIHILGGLAAGSTYHYSWNGVEWSEEEAIPYKNASGVALTYNNKLHLLSGYATADKRKHYSWDGISWTEESTLPYYFSDGQAVVYDEKIVLLGGYGYTQNNYSGYYNNNINHIKFGSNRHVLDMRDDTADVSKVSKGITAHGKTGLLEGTRPKYFKNESSKYLRLLRKPIKLYTDTSVVAFYLNGSVPVYLRASSTNVQLYTVKTDGTTESSVNIATSVAVAYQPTFYILKVRYVTSNTVFIYYQYDTSATAKTSVTIRMISIKYDNTLFVGTAYGIGAATTQTVDYFPEMIRYLFTNGNDFFRAYKAVTMTTGATAIYALYYYFNITAGSGGNANTASVNISANVNCHLPDLDACCIKGGLFYKNASSVDNIFIAGGYNTSGRVLTLSAAGSAIAEIGSLNHYILGLSTAGYLITVKATGDAKTTNKTLYAWIFDYTSTTNVMLPVGSGVDIGNKQLIAFKNDVLIFADGSRKLFVISNNGPVIYDLEPLETITMESFAYLNSKNYIGPESEPWEGVFIYGD